MAAGDRGFTVGADNRAGAWGPIGDLADTDRAFAVPVRTGLLAVDVDVQGLTTADAQDRLAAAATLRDAALAAGVPVVVTSSGQARHQHLYLNVGDPAQAGSGEAVAHRSLLDWLTCRGLDPRPAIRPPLAAHRLTGRSELVTPTDPANALAALTGPSPAGARDLLAALGVQPLSERMRRVLRDGHRAGGYTSPSHARLAVAVAAHAAGLTPGWLQRQLTDPALALGVTFRARNRRWQDRELDRLWTKAQVRVRSGRRRPYQGRPDALEDLERFAGALTTVPWPGMGGATDLAVAEALAELGRRGGGPVFPAALATIAVEAGVSEATARRSLRRLQRTGWLRIVAAATPTQATVWRLHTPADVTTPTRPTVPARPAEGGGGELGEDLARWQGRGHRGLGKSTMRVLRALTVRSRQGDSCQVAELAADLHASANSVRIHLWRLEAHGLAVRDGRRWRRGSAETATVAEQLGVAGTGATQRAQVAARRAARARLREQWSQARAVAVTALAQGNVDGFRDCAAVLPNRILEGLYRRYGPAPPQAA